MMGQKYKVLFASIGGLFLMAVAVFSVVNGTVDSSNKDSDNSSDKNLIGLEKNQYASIEGTSLKDQNNLVLNKSDGYSISKTYRDYYKEKDYAGHAMLFASSQFVHSLERDAGDFNLHSGDEFRIESSMGVEETIIVPIYDNDNVAFLSYYRRYGDGEYAFALMSDVTSMEWKKYPPVSVEDAERILEYEMPTASMNREARVVFHSNANDPLYEIEVVDTNENSIVYVDIHSGVVNELAPMPQAVDSEADDHPFYINDSGRLAVLEIGLSDEEKEFWRNEANETNKWIENGSLVIDTDLNIIKDTRPDEAFE